MKHLKIFLIFSVLQIIVQTLNAQNITADTTLANKLYRDAYNGLKYREYQHLDSFIGNFSNAAEKIKKYEIWNKYLDIQCGLVECYARKRMLSETKSTAQLIIKKSQKYFGNPNAYSGTAWHNLGLCYYYKKNSDSALVNYKKGLNMRIFIY